MKTQRRARIAPIVPRSSRGVRGGRWSNRAVARRATSGEILPVRSRQVALLPRLALALAVGGVVWVAPTAVAATTTSTTSTAATTTETRTRTITEPAKTDTVTQTSTTTAPQATTSVTNRTATVQVTPAGTTTQDQSGSSGLPAWGWVLIGVGAVAIGAIMFLAGRRGGRPPNGPTGPPPPPAPGTGTGTGTGTPG